MINNAQRLVAKKITNEIIEMVGVVADKENILEIIENLFKNGVILLNTHMLGTMYIIKNEPMNIEVEESKLKLTIVNWIKKQYMLFNLDVSRWISFCDFYRSENKDVDFTYFEGDYF